jgi:hypothetical protein
MEAHDTDLRIQERAMLREDAWRRRIDQRALALDPPGWLLAKLGPVPTDVGGFDLPDGLEPDDRVGKPLDQLDHRAASARESGRCLLQAGFQLLRGDLVDLGGRGADRVGERARDRVWVVASWRRRRLRPGSSVPPAIVRGLRGQTEAVAEVLDGWARVPVRPMLCLHSYWSVRARPADAIRVAAPSQLPDVVRNGPRTPSGELGRAVDRLLAVLRPAA